MGRKHPTCQYPRAEQTPEDYLVRVIGQLTVNDQFRQRLNPSFRSKPVNFKRIKNCTRFRDVEPAALEQLLLTVVRNNRVFVTNGVYYLPKGVVPWQEVSTPDSSIES
jgi:hypothetical protein